MIFTISSQFRVSLPGTMNDLLSRHNAGIPPHVTYKQPTFIEPSKVQSMSDDLALLVRKQATRNLIFDTYHISKTKSGYCVMLNGDNPWAFEFQKKILDVADKYGVNIYDRYRAYEEDFHPHLTIARAVSDDDLVPVLSGLISPISARALASSLHFITSDDDEDKNFADKSVKVYRFALNR